MVSLLPVWPVSLFPSMFSNHDVNLNFVGSTDNLRFTFQPAAIVFPNTAQDVSAIMQIAQEFNYSVVARSGGVRVI